jgi:aminoglycoside phosphotransferase (APT) family kinase protein
VTVDVHLARRLVDRQFPQWAGLPLTPVPAQGCDNRTFRLGDTLSVRLPSAHSYAAQVDKEQCWLPLLAPRLPLPVPVPVARGVPGLGYPHPWSVLRWIPGEPASTGLIADLTTFAFDLAAFLVALRRIDATPGPAASRHNFFRVGLSRSTRTRPCERWTASEARSLGMPPSRSGIPRWRRRGPRIQCGFTATSR